MPDDAVLNTESGGKLLGVLDIGAFFKQVQFRIAIHRQVLREARNDDIIALAFKRRRVMAIDKIISGGVDDP